jgi:hypothetical protein
LSTLFTLPLDNPITLKDTWSETDIGHNSLKQPLNG